MPLFTFNLLSLKLFIYKGTYITLVVMVLSTRTPNPLYPYKYKVHTPDISLRDLIVLTLGSVEVSMTEPILYTLAKNFLHRLDINNYSISLVKRTYTALLGRLRNDGIVSYLLDPIEQAYKIQLTNKGLGELDAILYSKSFVLSKWNGFKEFAFLAVS